MIVILNTEKLVFTPGKIIGNSELGFLSLPCVPFNGEYLSVSRS